MSYTIYPNQFNFNDNGTYKGLAAIKGDDGDTAGFGSVTASVNNTSGTPTVTVTTSGPNTAKNISFAFSGIKGEGIGSGVFTPAVSFASAQPSDAPNNTLWVKDCDSFTLGEVIVGTSSTLPTTRADGTALQSGDLYVQSGAANARMINWGNVNINPIGCWVRSDNSWVYKQAEYKVGGTWYETRTQYIIENGNIVGPISYMESDGTTDGFTVEKVGDYLVFTGHGVNYQTITFGENTSSEKTMFLEGEFYSASGSGKYGATAFSSAGKSTSVPTYTGTTETIATGVVVTDIIFYKSATDSNQYACGITIGSYSSTYGAGYLRIKNLYITYADARLSSS